MKVTPVRERLRFSMIRILLFITALSYAISFEKTKNNKFLLLKLKPNPKNGNPYGYFKNVILNKLSLTAIEKSNETSNATSYPKAKGFRMFGNKEWPDIFGDQSHEKKGVQPRPAKGKNTIQNFRNHGEYGFRTESKKDKSGSVLINITP